MEGPSQNDSVHVCFGSTLLDLAHTNRMNIISRFPSIRVARSLIFALLIALLAGCGTLSRWTGESSPARRQYQRKATYFYGSHWDFLIFTETRGGYAGAHLLDLPFSFCADLVLLPASIPLTHRNANLPKDEGALNKSLEDIGTNAPNPQR